MQAPHTYKSLSYRTVNWAESKFKTIREIEDRPEYFDRAKMKHLLYRVAVDLYREYHNLPPVVSYKEPFSFSPSKEWSSILNEYVAPEERNKLELSALKQMVEQEA